MSCPGGIGGFGYFSPGSLGTALLAQYHDASRTHPINESFIVLVAWRVELSIVRFLTEICGLRVSVET